jgi:phosphoglycolate phosphatase
MSRLNVTKDCAVLAGDSDVDVITAHNAGIECIGCTWGFRGEKELRDAGADYIAYTPNGISELSSSL